MDGGGDTEISRASRKPKKPATLAAFERDFAQVLATQARYWPCLNTPVVAPESSTAALADQLAAVRL